MNELAKNTETETKHHSSGSAEFALLAGFSGFVKYKHRIPDPGKCKVLSINFEKKRLEVTNGAVRLYPSFSEVEFISHSQQLEWINKYITDEGFPKEHMDALCHIVGLFNECEESEKEIFDFAKKLYADYAS